MTAVIAEGLAASQLRAFIDRIERLEEEKTNIAGDIRDAFAQAKAQGYDVKVMRKIIALRKKSREDRREEEELLQMYQAALGMD